MQPTKARKILAQVKEDYDNIAPHFSQTRSHGWEEFGQFKPFIKKGDNILDLGCGNGRLFDFLAPFDINYTGTDNSNALLTIASEKYPQAKFVYGDFMHIPFEKKEYDIVFSIASLHHVPSEPLRLRALKEIHRILKPGGYLLMTNWYLFQGKYQKLINKYTLKKFLRKNDMDYRDILVPWSTSDKEIIAERYYHAFTTKELEKLAIKVGFKIISQNMGDINKKRNIVSIWQK